MRGFVSASANSITWLFQSRGPGLSAKEELRIAAKPWHVSEVSLNGSLERPFHEVVKVKPGIPWNPQDLLVNWTDTPLRSNTGGQFISY